MGGGSKGWGHGGRIGVIKVKRGGVRVTVVVEKRLEKLLKVDEGRIESLR